VLTGRNGERLAQVAETCRTQGAEIALETLDVTAAAPLAAWIARQYDAQPLDLVIANAGISAGTGRHGESDEQARRIFQVNLDGVVNTVQPALARMRPRRRGQIALMSSLASFRGFPGAPAYCASKAAVRIWGEALRGELRREGIGVSVICPGFIESPMTAVNDFPMPCLMPAGKAAAIIRRGLARERARIAFPFPTYFAAWLLGVLPPRATDRLLARLPSKA
jgi:short-subunit dehydrogenase